MGNTSARTEESETQDRLNVLRELGNEKLPTNGIARKKGVTKRATNDPQGIASGPKRPD